MKKRLLSILLMCCMVLTLLPTAAFAEGSEEELPICTCETACTAESLNADCPVCGAEGASAENCAKYIKPADDAAVQPEGEVSDPQPEAALTALIGGSETVTEVSTAKELTAAIADSNVSTVKLTENIDINTTLIVTRTVTLDLNGHVLQYKNDNTKGSVIVIENGGQLTIQDSDPDAPHKFDPNSDGLWVLNENGSKTVSGGVITGGTGYPFPLGSTVYCGGGVYIAPGGQLTMTGGNIIGCSAEYGGGVCIYPWRDGEQMPFSMSGGSIIGCVASDIGGGVYASGKFQMSDEAVIRSCTAEGTTFNCGGGVYVNLSSEFVMSGEAEIEGCQVISEYANGGGVYVNSSSSFVMTDKAKIEGCQTISNPSYRSNGGGVHLANNTKFTLSGSAVIQNCKAVNSDGSGEAYGGGVSADCMRQITLADSARIADCIAANGSGLYITGSQVDPADYGKLLANGGSVEGDVVLGEANNPCTVIGSGGTVFNGKVTVTPGSTIKSGTFNGEVTNNGTITGGTFNGEVINNGTINDGVFTGIVSGNGKITGGTFNPLITGSGTETDPYQISTAEGLKWFRDKVNHATKQADTQICAELTEDIDLSCEEWTPIGIGGVVHWGTPSYSGTFDGKGHTIKNLSIDNSSAQYVGLFGYVLGGTIRNLTVSGSVKGSGHTGGIAGLANGGTFENCANLCVVQSDSTEGGTTGGIIGFTSNMDHELIVRDCYNVGSITGRHAGGIIGQCNWHETIRNCYNAGTVTGTANVGAIIGIYSSDKISNCYYLEGSVTRAGYGDKASIAKTATEFADGTVLALLKTGERDNNADPWADECKYLAAADKTLPVFNGQGDAHTHNGNWTSNGNGTHSRRCTCNAVETQNCSGGTATCTAKAVCEVCKAEYGEKDPEHHAECCELEWVVTETEHEQKYSLCGKVTIAKEKHTFGDWTVAQRPTSNRDGEKERICQICQYKETKTIPATGSNYSYYTIKATAGAGGSISPSGNVSVREGRDQTFTITPDKGYAVANVKIDGKSIGAVKSYTFENVSRTHTIEVIFMKANGNPQTGVFVDVATGSYYEDAVDWAVENGITKGTDDTHFSPDGICTRAQAVTFLWRAAGSPEPKTSTMPFTDVNAGSYYYDAVLWAVENGITEGTSDTTFSPNATCTRAQIVAFLWRSEKSPAAGTANPFADVKSTAYYAGAVLWAVKENITKGTTNTTFSPDADCTRAQIVTFLWRCKK